MKKTACCMALAFMLWRPATVFGSEADAVLERISARYGSVSSLTAAFRQNEKVAALGRSRVSEGTLRMKKPGRMRWDYESPEKRVFVTNGVRLWMYYQAEKKVYTYDLAQDDLTRTPLALLFRKTPDLTAFFKAVSVAPEGEGMVRLDLAPLRPSRDLGSVSLIVRSSDGALAGTVIKDSFGNVNEIRLSSVVENASIKDDIFSFIPPPGTSNIEGPPGGRRAP